MLSFGIFDHLDSNGAPLGSFFEERLRLVELIEKCGFHAYHLAEHHSTPLGMAASPSVFLAAAIQRTTKIKLGPLVYVLPLYHPLRLYEEICMLDHLSQGRLSLGVGRGGALLEHQRYGIDPTLAPAMYHEAFAVLMRAFECDVLDFDGKFFKYKDYVVQAKAACSGRIRRSGMARRMPRRSPGRRHAASMWYRLGPLRERARSATATAKNGAISATLLPIYRRSASRGTLLSPTPTRRRSASRTPPIRAGAMPWTISGGAPGSSSF